MNTLTKIFVLSIVALIAFMLIMAPDVQTVKRGKADFHVNASDRLYFKNIRRYYYHSFPTKEDQFEALILKRSLSNPMSPLRFSILNNWRMDEAYILLADTGDAVLGTLEIGKDSTLKWSLEAMDAEAQMVMAMDLFEKLQDDDQEVFYSTVSGERIPLWEQQEDRQLVLTVLRDYFKLIGAL